MEKIISMTEEEFSKIALEKGFDKHWIKSCIDDCKNDTVHQQNDKRNLGTSRNNFPKFSVWHILPILLLAAGILLTYKFREKIALSGHEKTFRLILGMAMMFAEMSYFWRLLYIGPSDLGEIDLMSRLPFQVCEWSCIFATLMVLTENRHFFDIDVVICLTLGIMPLFLPAVIQRTGPAYFRYYQFWLEHLLPIYSVFYMMFVKGWRYDAKKIYKPIAYMVVLGIVCVYLNARIPQGTYMYLQGDDLGETITSLLPEGQFGRLAVFLGIELVLAAIEYLVFRLVYRKQGKRAKAA